MKATIAFLSTFAFCACLDAASVTLAWDPNKEPDVAGYRLYYGTPAGSFGTVVNTGNVTNHTVTDLRQGASYAFYVTCYNTSGLESEPSNVVTYQAPASAPTPPKGVKVSESLSALGAGADPRPAHRRPGGTLWRFDGLAALGSLLSVALSSARRGHDPAWLPPGQAE
jgi:hypothetical protein